MKKVAITVIAYKKYMTEFEMISYKSLLSVFCRKYDIIIVCPEGLNVGKFLTEGVRTEYFKEKWFSSYRRYSEFCLQPELYERFKDYEYILLYQLDGFTFYDNLEYFCNLGYDYIAAPWKYGNFWYKNQYETVWYVGCGGVSLRKVSVFIDFTKNEAVTSQVKYEPEDMIIVSAGDKLKIAPVNVAEKFCITEYYDDLNGEKPMLLHWLDHMDNKSFRNAILECGYDLPPNLYPELVWDKEAQIRKINYWKSEYKLCDIKRALDEMIFPNTKAMYMWGTGNNALLASKIFNEIGIEILDYIDNDKKKQMSEFMGKKVLDFNDVMESKPFIIVSPTKYEEIETRIRKYGYEENQNYILWSELVKKSGLYKGGL